MSEVRNEMSVSNGVALRPATSDDQQFLMRVYRTTREEELKLVPWNEEQRQAFVAMQFHAQDSYYRERFPDASYDVITLDGEAIGRLYVLRNDEQIRIMDINVMPEFRNAGIGGALIQNLMEEAKQTNRPLRIYVEKFNPSYQLFQRRCFVPIEEGDVSDLLELKAQ